jgi:uncharacterized protein
MIFLTAQWRNLVVLTYPVPSSILTRYLPQELELDLWQGQALTSLVGFQFLDTRVIGWPAWFHRDFPEVNLRFYVRRETSEGIRRGVVFIKEIVPKPAVASLARVLFGENYVCLPMQSVVDAGRSALYEWNFQGRTNSIAAYADGPPSLPAAESLDGFILEHHWGYSCLKDGGCLEYQVERPMWRVYPVASHEASVDAAGIYGSEFAEALASPPVSVIFAEGSGVSVSFGTRV